VTDIIGLADLAVLLAGSYPLQCLGLLVLCELGLAAKSPAGRLGNLSAILRALADAFALVLSERTTKKDPPKLGSARVLATQGSFRRPVRSEFVCLRQDR